MKLLDSSNPAKANRRCCHGRKLPAQGGLFGSGCCPTSLADEPADRVTRLGTISDPSVNFLQIEIGVVALHHRIVGSQGFDEAAITARATVRRDDVIVWLVFRAFSFKSERYHGGLVLAGCRGGGNCPPDPAGALQLGKNSVLPSKIHHNLAANPLVITHNRMVLGSRRQSAPD